MKLVDHHEVFNTIQRVLPEEKGNVVPKVRIWFGLQDLRLDSGFWPYSLEAICGNMVTRDHREWKIFCQITASCPLSFTLLSAPQAGDRSFGHYWSGQHHHPHWTTCSPKVSERSQSQLSTLNTFTFYWLQLSALTVSTRWYTFRLPPVPL